MMNETNSPLDAVNRKSPIDSRSSFPKVYILILNYNGWVDTIECLESVFRNIYPNYQLVLIDNGSTDNSLHYIKYWADGKLEAWITPKVALHSLMKPVVMKPITYDFFTLEDIESDEGRIAKGSRTNKSLENSLKGLVIIQSGDNLGFAGGNNIGIKYALQQNADYTLLLNNDTVVEPDFLMQLIEVAEEKPDYGIFGGQIRYYNSPSKTWARGGGYISKWTSSAGHYGMGKKYDVNDRTIREIDYVTGCMFLIKREVINKIGLMDERYFLYYEETDWCIKARNAGFKCVYVPSSKIYHKESNSIKRDNPVIIYYYTRNRIYLVKKLYKGVKKRIAILYLKLFNFLRIHYNLVRGKKEKTAFIKKAIRDSRNDQMGEFIK